jgi:hypothetical protein
MNNYSDLQDIDTRLNLVIELAPVGLPTATIIINNQQYDYPQLSMPIIINEYLPLMALINIDIILSDKHYTLEYETAVIIKRLSIDNIELIPKYDYLAEYINDHTNNNPTNYLGFNGKWRLTIDQPFYHWLHEHSGQGWLIG